MKLSVVTTLYGSETTVAEFHRRMSCAAEAISGKVEFVYVNDGSPDSSLELILELRQQDPRICVADLARNFGHHPALMTGLEAASGDYIFLIDSDLEEAPELLPHFWQLLNDNPAADAVYGVQIRRKGGYFERLAGRLWYALFCRLTKLPYPADSLTARLMTRRLVDAVLLHKERDLDMMGIFSSAGHDQLAFPAAKTSKGSSTYTAQRRLDIALTGLTSLTTAPLTLILVAGVVILLTALFSGGAWLLLAFSGVVGLSLAGVTIWSIWAVGGLLLTALGIVALYLGRTLQEAKARPRAIVRHFYQAETS